MGFQRSLIIFVFECIGQNVFLVVRLGCIGDFNLDLPLLSRGSKLDCLGFLILLRVRFRLKTDTLLYDFQLVGQFDNRGRR